MLYITLDGNYQKSYYHLIVSFNTSIVVLTCKQSKAVLTILEHLDWHASSKGRKYLSASIKFALALGMGSADEEFFSELMREIQYVSIMISTPLSKNGEVWYCSYFILGSFIRNITLF